VYEKSFVWLKNDGSVQLNGNADNLVKHAALNTALQAEVTKINTELGKIAAGINAIVPGSYVVTPISVDITSAKVNNLNCS